MRAAALVALLLAGCGARASAPAPAARRLAVASAVATPSGARIEVAAGWWVSDRGGVIEIQDPDRQLKAWFLESREADGAAAIAAGWRHVAPGFAHRLSRAPETPPPDDGWDAVTRADYDAGPDRVVEALARRHRGITYLALLIGERAAVARRGAQLERAIASLHPRGLRPESLAGTTPGAIDAPALDRFIGAAMARLAVPGAAVAVVRDGAVVYERGFGVRALGGAEPVTPQTLFLIGSVTKSMTTMMQAAEVDAGLFAWDTPVTSVLPSFALADADLTRRIVMWHMSCACTGMPRSDLEHIFEYRGVTAEARVASMRAMAPTTRLGETFQYSNVMVAAGGYAAAHADAPRLPLGQAYDDAMRRRIFEPIGMTSSTLDPAVALRGEHAMPHGLDLAGVVRAVPLEMEDNVVTIRPAGGVWSNARDMERYVMTELAGGVAPGGRRVVSTGNLEARRVIRIGGPDDGYGLGLGVGRQLGLRVLEHDGGAFGFGTTMYMLPDQRIAIVILTNIRNDVPGEYLPFNAVVKRAIIEAMFPRARRLATATLDHFARLTAERAAAGAGLVRRPPDAAWLRSLAGRYTNDRLGAVTLTATASEIVFDAGEWQRSLAQAKEGRSLVFVEPPFAGTPIAVGGDRAHPTFTVAAGQDTYVFTRAP